MRHGFDPKNGARNLRRTVTREVEDRLSEAMLAGKIAAGMHMRVLACGEEIKLEQCNPNK